MPLYCRYTTRRRLGCRALDHPSVAECIQAQSEDVPNMNTTMDARAGLTSAQENVQTVLLIIVTVVGAWLAFYEVPWHLSGDPCLLAAAATRAIVMCLWLTRWRFNSVPGYHIFSNFHSWQAFLEGTTACLSFSPRKSVSQCEDHKEVPAKRFRQRGQSCRT
jgi:hypothetical protein